MSKPISFDELCEMPVEKNIRFTKTKCLVAGEYHRKNSRENLEFKRDRYGAIKVSWSGHIPIKTMERERCDLGHSHSVEKFEYFVWDYVTLSKAEIKELISFLEDSK